MSKAKNIDHLYAKFADALKYAPETGKLLWKENRTSRVRAGMEAGRPLKDTGYRQVKFAGGLHLTHRIIFLLAHGYCPDVIDHIDGDKTNNRIENLRPATTAKNAMNKRGNKQKSEELKGVYKSWSKWRARICICGYNIQIGTFDSKEKAAVAYNRAAIRWFGPYARLNRIGKRHAA